MSLFTKQEKKPIGTKYKGKKVHLAVGRKESFQPEYWYAACGLRLQYQEPEFITHDLNQVTCGKCKVSKFFASVLKRVQELKKGQSS